MTITTRTEYAQTITENADTNEATASMVQGGRTRVTFGRIEGSEFICSHAAPSKSYKTPTGAARAIRAWVTR